MRIKQGAPGGVTIPDQHFMITLEEDDLLDPDPGLGLEVYDVLDDPAGMPILKTTVSGIFHYPLFSEMNIMHPPDILSIGDLCVDDAFCCLPALDDLREPGGKGGDG
jgi:hypothetical protein